MKPSPALLPSGSSCRRVPHPEPVDQHYSDPTPAQKDPASSSSAHQQSWSNPTTPTRSSPVPVEKRASSVGAVCGNDSSYINITDFSVTDGIDSEHKQEQRSKGARSTRRCGQQTS